MSRYSVDAAPKYLARNNFPFSEALFFLALGFPPFSRAEHRSLTGGLAQRGASWRKRGGKGQWIALLPTPPGKREAQGLSRLSGGLFFGYFLLAMQKKVSRLPVRETGFEWPSRSESDSGNLFSTMSLVNLTLRHPISGWLMASRLTGRRISGRHPRGPHYNTECVAGGSRCRVRSAPRPRFGRFS